MPRENQSENAIRWPATREEGRRLGSVRKVVLHRVVEQTEKLLWHWRETAIRMSKYIAFLVFLLLSTQHIAASAQVTQRPVHAEFKGVEMVSWNDAETGAWRFSLLPGTNRNKTESEILSDVGAISEIGDLQRRFESLAVDEQVFWASPNPETFPYPPADVVERIGKIAMAAKIRLVIVE